MAAGVEVRLQVDAIGSEVDLGSRRSSRTSRRRRPGRRPRRVFVARDGPLGRRRLDAADDCRHFDHRKMVVVDGGVAYVGGSGIEDHYNDERFYDVMCRVTGPSSPSSRSSSWRAGATRAARWTPRPRGVVPARVHAGRPRDAAQRIATTVLWNVPGTGHHPISDAIETSIEARRRPDRHRQPVHQQPGDPGPAARGRAARCRVRLDRAREADPALPGRRLPPSLRAPDRRPGSRSCSIPTWPMPRSSASTIGCSSAAATSTTCRCSGTPSSTCCSRRPRSSNDRAPGLRRARRDVGPGDRSDRLPREDVECGDGPDLAIPVSPGRSR